MNDSTLRRPLRRLKRLWALRILVRLLDGAGDDPVRLTPLRAAAAGVLRVRDPAAFATALRRAHARAERSSGSLDPARLPPLRALAATFALAADDTRVLLLAALGRDDGVLSELANAEHRYRPSSPAAATLFACDALGIEARRVARTLSRRSALVRSGLLRVECARHYVSPLDRFEPAEGIEDFVARGRGDMDGVLSRYFRRIAPGALSLADYPHLDHTLPCLRQYLADAAGHARIGANVVLHGPPGTGKSELARAVAHAAGLQGYLVRTADEDGDPIDGYERLRAFHLAQCALADRRDAVLVFDEVEDVFRGAEARFGARSVAFKGWLNECLERNRVPTIWICNELDALEAAQLRRLDIVLEVPVPTRAVRRELLDRHLAPFGIGEDAREAWSAHPALTPAMLARTARVLSRSSVSGADAARRSLEELLLVEGQAPLPRARRSPAFELDWLNPDAALQPVLDAIARDGSGRVCLYGPPGTGKTAFGLELARRLDRAVLRKRASDLLSPYVGVAERNIALAFREAGREGAVLLLDEADSFLRARDSGQRSWELSQVNELLTQIEDFEGVFVASTNLFDLLDPAALRRFDYKLRFDYLRAAQRCSLFAARCGTWGLQRCLPEDQVTARLGTLHLLTPGDFAAIDRQVRALGADASDIRALALLEQEQRLKPEGRQRAVGFLGA